MSACTHVCVRPAASALRSLPTTSSAAAAALSGAVRNPPLPFHRICSTSAPHSQGGVEKYLVKVGDAIAAGDRIAEVSTDKATVDFDVVDDGIVAKFLIPEGTQDVAVGTPMIVLCDEPEDVAAFADFTAGAAAPAEAPAAAAPAPAPAAAAAAVPTNLGSGTLPAFSGRIYYNAEKGWYRA